MANDNEPFLKPGGRNLLILGLIGIVLAIISTGISLTIYRATGDIYLDRSRPGYISEDEVHDSSEDAKERFASDGEVTKDVLDEYAKEVYDIYQRLESSKDAFSGDVISDETLGIAD